MPTARAARLATPPPRAAGCSADVPMPVPATTFAGRRTRDPSDLFLPRERFPCGAWHRSTIVGARRTARPNRCARRAQGAPRSAQVACVFPVCVWQSVEHAYGARSPPRDGRAARARSRNTANAMRFAGSRPAQLGGRQLVFGDELVHGRPRPCRGRFEVVMGLAPHSFVRRAASRSGLFHAWCGGRCGSDDRAASPPRGSDCGPRPLRPPG